MGIMKSFSSQTEKSTYIDLGYGDVAIGLNVDEDFGSVVFENIKKSKELGSRVKPEEVLKDDNRVVITFPARSPEELDLLIIRLLELRQAQYGLRPFNQE